MEHAALQNGKCPNCGAWSKGQIAASCFMGVKIVADDSVPLGMMKIVHPDGRVEFVHFNFP